jgi:lipopolysaccharide export system protein LptC
MSDLSRTDKACLVSLGPPPRGKARAHSRMVRVLRVLLPLTVVGMIAALAGLVVMHAIRRAAATRLDIAAPIRMVNPHFFGRDSQDRPYTLSARAASRDPISFQRVLLDHPVVVLNTGGPHPASLAADRGVYQEDTRILILTGNVRGVDAKSAHFASDQAVVNTRTGSVTGPHAVADDPSHGAIQSKSFDVYDKGDRVVFKGGVHARLDAR